MDKFLIVKKAIDSADYCSLLRHGAPNDEYDSESEKISERISDTDSAERISEIMAEVFTKSFNVKFPTEMFIEAAGEIRRGIQDRMLRYF